jgi:hypothetical protein
LKFADKGKLRVPLNPRGHKPQQLLERVSHPKERTYVCGLL